MSDLIPNVEANNDDANNEIQDDEYVTERSDIVVKEKNLRDNDVVGEFNEDFEKFTSPRVPVSGIKTSKLLIVKDRREIDIISEVFLSACN
jgi:hypothetical protein